MRQAVNDPVSLFFESAAVCWYCRLEKQTCEYILMEIVAHNVNQRFQVKWNFFKAVEMW